MVVEKKSNLVVVGVSVTILVLFTRRVGLQPLDCEIPDGQLG